MSINELLTELGNYNLQIVLIFIGLALSPLIYGRMHPKYRGALPPYKYVYATLIYLVSIPGIFSILLTLYSLFVIRANLLEVNLVIYFVPIIAMVVAILLIKRNVDLDYIPGFDRLIGLFALIAITLIITLLILQTLIWILFRGSMVSLAIIGILLFLGLQWAANRVFQDKPEPRYPKSRW